MGPLAGIRIVEFVGVGPAPMAAMLLADLGAEVIRIDRVEPSRLGVAYDGRYDITARGRRSIALDLARPEGAEIALRLSDRADLLVESYRPGVMERLGLGPDVALRRNPRLVYGRLTGFGQTGPLSRVAGHDLNYIALAGALDAIGGPEKPVPPLNLVGDYAGGSLYFIMGVLAALVERSRSGKGQIVDCSIAEGVLSLMSVFFTLHASGVWDRPRGQNFLDGGAPYYDTYATSDGRFMAVAPLEPKFFRLLVEKLGLDPALADRQMDRDAWPEIRRSFEQVFRSRTRAEWTALFEGTDCCVTPVLSLGETGAHPHFAERASVLNLSGLVQPSATPRFSRTRPETPPRISTPGDATVEILRSLGFDDREVGELERLGVVRDARDEGDMRTGDVRPGERNAGMVDEGELMWTPGRDRIERSHLTAFRDWLSREKGLRFAGFEDMWRWSVDEMDSFWAALLAYFDVAADGDVTCVRRGASMQDTRWFPDARMNYAERLLRHERFAAPGEVALRHLSETRPLGETTWHELGARVRSVATGLRKLGIRPGDRVVSYLPNVPETVIAMLATVAIGGVWSAAAPEFGARTVIDRFGQIAPRLIFAADGYQFGGKPFDRREEVSEILSTLDSIETLIWLPYCGEGPPAVSQRVLSWDELVDEPDGGRESFLFDRVPCDHPLWVLYSSGTTGLPKAIAHSHVGIILDQVKQMHLHFDLTPGQSMFFYTTTGWMMWNAVLSALFTGAAAVLYDGSPTWPRVDRLWDIAATTRATMVGASPTLVAALEKLDQRPGETYDLSCLDAVVLGGAPSTPATYDWLYRNVKRDMWVINTSGGTDLCGGLVGPVPGKPVRAAEMQGRMLGIAVETWSDAGEPVTDAVGELVVTRPFPSIPLFFWGDRDGSRMRESYFEHFPGVWRHGDYAKITSDGGAYVYGRADATLNRYGVRIGTSEIYAVMAEIPEIRDALVICCETGDGGYFMPLFVAMAEGASLDERLSGRIRDTLREQASPRHVPDRIVQVPEVPYTLTGKKMEVPIRRVIMGADPGMVLVPDAMANPSAAAWFAEFASRPEIAGLFARPVAGAAGPAHGKNGGRQRMAAD